MSRPRVAVLITSYFFGSHADVIATRLIEGYPWRGEHVDARVEVVAMYLEQRTTQLVDGGQRDDIGVEIAERNGIPLFDTVGETLGCGDGGLAVDGVVIIGEHGDYELNEFGQQLYPRRRLFDAAIAVMTAVGRYVPIFNDKGLGYSTDDALAMIGTARRFDLPLVAGSTIPLSWRVPTGAAWPLGAAMTDVVAVGFGPPERYGFHTLEGLQAFAERRAGGETGVVAVTAYGDAEARSNGLAAVDPDLTEQAFAALEVNGDDLARAREAVDAVYVIDYADGLRGAVVQCQDPAVRSWAVACRGPQDDLACQIYLPGSAPAPTDHFIFLVRQIEHAVLTGQEPTPVERTVVTTGVLDAAMHALVTPGTPVPTPRLNGIAYQVTGDPADTGTGSVFPEPARPEEAKRPSSQWSRQRTPR